MIIGLLPPGQDLYREGIVDAGAVRQLADVIQAPSPHRTVGLQRHAEVLTGGYGGGGHIGPGPLLVHRAGDPADVQLEKHEIDLTVGIGIADLHGGMAHGAALLGVEVGGPQHDPVCVGGVGQGDQAVAHRDGELVHGKTGQGLLPAVPVIQIEAGQELALNGLQGNNGGLVLPDADDLAAHHGLRVGVHHSGLIGDIDSGGVIQQHEGMLQLTDPGGIDVSAVSGVLTQFPVGVVAPAPDGAVLQQSDAVVITGGKGTDAADGSRPRRIHSETG